MHASRFVSLLALAFSLTLAASCTTRGRLDIPDTGLGTDSDAGMNTGHDGGTIMGTDGGGTCLRGSCYTVYAHSTTVLYSVDLTTNSIHHIGRFQPTGTPDTMTDLAVAGDGTIYVVSKTAIYTADPNTGLATMRASLSVCGTDTVAASLGSDGYLYTGDYMTGALCAWDISGTTPRQVHMVTLSGGYALAGDIVVVSDGTMFGTVYRIGDASGTGTQASNILASINPTTGAVTTIGTGTGYPNLFGVAYQNGQVFGFTHESSGSFAGVVVTIDRTTGVGTPFGSPFMDSGHTIAFAGAGVNVNVPIIPM
jgi:hypothetical protein